MTRPALPRAPQTPAASTPRTSDRSPPLQSALALLTGLLCALEVCKSRKKERDESEDRQVSGESLECCVLSKQHRAVQAPENSPVQVAEDLRRQEAGCAIQRACITGASSLLHSLRKPGEARPACAGCPFCYDSALEPPGIARRGWQTYCIPSD